jgi:hypothetical protein
VTANPHSRGEHASTVELLMRCASASASWFQPRLGHAGERRLDAQIAQRWRAASSDWRSRRSWARSFRTSGIRRLAAGRRVVPSPAVFARALLADLDLGLEVGDLGIGARELLAPLGPIAATVARSAVGVGAPDARRSQESVEVER